MAFRKAIGGRIRAGNKVGRAGFGAAMGGRIRRWAGTIPIAYWKVQGVASDATTLPDVSKRGFGLDGTLGGTVNENAGDTKTWNTAQLPPGSTQCLYFNGTNNTISVAYNSNLKPTSVNKLSISMWVKTTDTSGYMLCAEASNGTTGWVYTAVGVPSAGASKPAAVYFYSATSPDWRTGGSTITNDDDWHHIVFVYDESAENSVTLYQDGVETAANNSQSGGWNSAGDNNVILQIGSRTDASVYYKFYMDEIAYFTDIGLTAAQVNDMYNNGTVTDSSAGILRG